MAYAADLKSKVSIDTREFDRGADAVDRRLRKLADSDPVVTITLDDSDLRRDVDSAQRALADIGDEAVNITGDASDLTAEVQSVSAALAGIEDETVGISADASQATAEVQGVAAGLAGLADETVGITADGAQARGEVQGVAAALAGIEDEDVRVTVEGAEARAEVQGVEAALAGLEDQTVRVNVEAQELSATLGGLGAGMGGVAGQAQGMRSQVGGSVAEMLGFGAAVDAADGSLDMLGGRLGGAVQGFGMLKAGIAGLATGAAATTFYELGSGALELRDTVNATNVVFGDSRRIIDDWATNSVDRVGLSERAFRDLSAPLGALMRSLGATGDEVANLSNEAISLGADFASVLGGSTQEAVLAIGAAFRGETEPIRRYGITLDAAAVSERALAMGLVDSSGEITNRAAVVRDLIVEQARANGIVGDFTRTQGEGVNALREAGAALEDAKNAWGELFAPAVEQGARAVKSFADASDAALPAIRFLGDALATGLSTALGPVKLVAEGVGGALRLLGIGAEDAKPPVRELTAEEYNLAEALRRGTGATTGSSEAKRDAATASRDLGDEEARTAAATDRLKESLDRLVGVNVSAELMQIRSEQSLLRVTEALRTNTHHLDGNSEAALNARAAAAQHAQGALSDAVAMREQGARTHEVNTFLQTQRTRLIEAMVAGGATRAAAERYIGTLGFTTEALARASGMTAHATGRTNELRGSFDRAGGAAGHTRGLVDQLTGAVHAVPGWKSVAFHTPGLGESLSKVQQFMQHVRDLDRYKGVSINWSFEAGIRGGRGDGPGNIRAAGKAIDRARAAATGLPVRMTSAYRTPAHNRRVGGSPTSYHLDRANPASDWVGPARALDEMERRLRRAGGFRELLWRTAGHGDHLHYAHEGGVVDRSWGTLPGLRYDERPVIAQVGEGILSRSDMGALASLAGGSSVPVAGPSVRITVNVAPGVGAAEVEALAYRGVQRALAEHDAESTRMLRAKVRV